MRDPTPRQRSQELSVLHPLVADTMIVVIMSAVAAFSGSLTLVGESIRILLLLLAGYWSLWCLMGVHRGRLERYEFGTSKMECFATALCGLCLLVGGLFLSAAVVSMIFAEHQDARPAALAIAAVVNAINVLINVLGLIGMLRARAENASEAFSAQLKVRWILLVASLGVQLSITASVLAQDQVFGIIFDALGASFVATVMIARGIGMLADAVPGLLDARAPERVRDAVAKALATIMPEMEVQGLRTRTVGGRYVAEVAFDGDCHLSIDRLRQGTAAALDALASLDCPVDVKLVPTARNHSSGVAGRAL